MRAASSTFTLLLATLTLVSAATLSVGCSSRSGTPRPTDAGRDAPFPVFADVGPPIDTGVDAPIPFDAGRDAGASSCVATCTSDSQCATSCPPNPTGANCCDRMTGTCYRATVAICPMPPSDDGGTSMY